ncbi:MAG: glutathione S-transferase family protein [Rhizobiales bacterium]|nr:glutathione S-transferase family protein [Hyphomicrobiales bacterium]MBI3673222.1 glutathione S-transferase family protein [Hyphomicrobiales bacterium]
MIRVWGRRSSINVQKVLWTLGELDLPFSRETVGGSFGGNRDADFLRMNPNGLIPVILDGDITMFESNAIVRYLAARYRAGVLRPAEPKALAAAEQWMEWQQSTVYAPVTTLFFNTARLPPDKRSPAAVAEAHAKLAPALAIADAHLARHDWFAGEDFSFGDIVMGALMWRYTGLGHPIAEHGHLAEWFDTIKERPSFRQHVATPVARSVEEWTRIERELA